MNLSNDKESPIFPIEDEYEEIILLEDEKKADDSQNHRLQSKNETHESFLPRMERKSLLPRTTSPLLYSAELPQDYFIRITEEFALNEEEEDEKESIYLQQQIRIEKASKRTSPVNLLNPIMETSFINNEKYQIPVAKDHIQDERPKSFDRPPQAQRNRLEEYNVRTSKKMKVEGREIPSGRIIRDIVPDEIVSNVIPSLEPSSPSNHSNIRWHRRPMPMPPQNNPPTPPRRGIRRQGRMSLLKEESEKRIQGKNIQLNIGIEPPLINEVDICNYFERLEDELAHTICQQIYRWSNKMIKRAMLVLVQDNLVKCIVELFGENINLKEPQLPISVADIQDRKFSIMPKKCPFKYSRRKYPFEMFYLDYGTTNERFQYYQRSAEFQNFFIKEYQLNHSQMIYTTMITNHNNNNHENLMITRSRDRPDLCLARFGGGGIDNKKSTSSALCFYYDNKCYYENFYASEDYLFFSNIFHLHKEAYDPKLLTKLYKTKCENERKEILFEEMDLKDLYHFNPNLLDKINFMKPANTNEENEEDQYYYMAQDYYDTIKKFDEVRLDKMANSQFPVWTQERIKFIKETHGSICFIDYKEQVSKETILSIQLQELKEEKQKLINLQNYLDLMTLENSQSDIQCQLNECRTFMTNYHKWTMDHKDCELCREYDILNVIQWWYENYFIGNESLKNTLVMSDLSKLPFLNRLKSLVILGERESGKTKFFQSLCNFDATKLVHFKNRFGRGESHKLDNKGVWLILIDDFCFSTKEEMQAVKSILAGESTIIPGKWLAKDYHGHIPCVILLNNEKDFNMLVKEEQIYSQCKFINLRNLYLGPPGTKSTQTVDLDFDYIPNVL